MAKATMKKTKVSIKAKSKPAKPKAAKAVKDKSGALHCANCGAYIQK